MKGFIYAMLVLALFVPAMATAATPLLVADFDSGIKPNNIGGDFGAWDRDPMDFSQTAIESFNSNKTRTGRGFCMRLDYDVDSPNPAYNGFWMKLNGSDVSKYDNFTFWVKGDEERGFATLFKVEMKNNRGEVGKYYVTGITDKWQKIEIPLTKIAGISDFTNMDEFVIVFEDWRASVKEGTVYFDDFQFE
ncbi:MAG: carbohydrate binding domain-containing protein [Candidatus Omnitrophica bacterium]|nr:carbohydrate binding domain-containing protein [Candidatus Omnitrophota bacterium]